MQPFSEQQLQQIDELLSFLPNFSVPNREYQSQPEEEKWPILDEDVSRFLDTLKTMQWPEPSIHLKSYEAMRLVRDEQATASADIDQLAWMFSWWYEGEKIDEGRYVRDLKNGTMQRLLSRLQVLRKTLQS